MLKAILILFRAALIAYALLVIILYCFQRALIYFPSHDHYKGGLTPWIVDGQTIGYCREVAEPSAVWLVSHGNAGQAAMRDYMLPCFASDASVYVVEYPGYGDRSGKPSATSLNRAVFDAYSLLANKYTKLGVGVVGESIGSGPACLLARHSIPPKKIILAVPFDSFVTVAASHMGFVPVRFILKDRWDNIEALKDYRGPMEIYGAINDTIIPSQHARRLAESVHATYIELTGGHNDWSANQVRFR